MKRLNYLFFSLLVFTLLFTCKRKDCRVDAYAYDRELVFNIIDSTTRENLIQSYLDRDIIVVTLNEHTMLPRSEEIWTITEDMEAIVYPLQIGCLFPERGFCVS